jgi:hypothetical protein
VWLLRPKLDIPNSWRKPLNTCDGVGRILSDGCKSCAYESFAMISAMVCALWEKNRAINNYTVWKAVHNPRKTHKTPHPTQFPLGLPHRHITHWAGVEYVQSLFFVRQSDWRELVILGNNYWDVKYASMLCVQKDHWFNSNVHTLRSILSWTSPRRTTSSLPSSMHGVVISQKRLSLTCRQAIRLHLSVVLFQAVSSSDVTCN